MVGVEGSIGRERNSIPFSERVSCTVKLASEASGLSRSRIYELIADGTLESSVIGGRRLIMVPSLLRLIKSGKDSGKDAEAA